jgi:hypothetical protein
LKLELEKMEFRTRLAFAALALFTGSGGVYLPAVAQADPAPLQQTVNFKPEFFKEFQVVTALDIVQHVPNFSFSSGAQVRGYAGAAGNVLVDGRRPVTKDTLQTVLGNIPLAQVDHVELIIGGAPGIDMEGYSRVVNIVRRRTESNSLAVIATDAVVTGNKSRPDVIFVFSRRAGDTNTDVNSEVAVYPDSTTNNIKIFSYTPGQPRAGYTYIKQSALQPTTKLTGDRSQPFLGGTLSLNGSYTGLYYKYDAIYSGSVQQGYEHANQNDVSSALGVQYERTLAKGWTLELDALDRSHRSTLDDRYRDQSGLTEFASYSKTREDIGSARMTWQASDRVSYKFGGEVASNRLAANNLYVVDGITNITPSDNVQVEEVRDEMFATEDLQISPSLNFEGSLKVENSRIADKLANRSKSLVYPKPRLQLVWSITPEAKVTWLSERVVGQLDFTEFATSVLLQTSVVTAGNPDLIPQQTWKHSLTLDYSFWKSGASTSPWSTTIYRTH